MAVERGGRADKLGNRYEGLWVARNLLRVLVGEVVAVTLEAVGDDEEGVDVWVELLDGTREAHQCKRKNRNFGKWTPAELRTRNVLARLAFQLRADPTNRFTFVSVHDAPELNSLCDLARTSNNDPDLFWATAESTAAHKDALRVFCTATGLNASTVTDRPAAYNLLQRADVRVFDDGRTSRQDVELLARLCVTGKPEAVGPLLANFAQERMGNALHADQVRDFLRAQGHPPRDLAGEPTLAGRIERLNEEFQGSLRPNLIGGTLIPRSHAEQVREALRSESNRLLVVHGRAGAGKSAVFLDLCDQLEAEGIPWLAIRLDRRTPSASSRQFGTTVCDLPDSPAVCLRALSGQRDAVLLLDQLDALRWTSGHGAANWEACQEVIDEALLLGRLRVMVACRSFDLRDDELIRNWLARQDAQRIEVSDLPETEVARIVDAAGGQFDSMRPAQRRLLCSPICLRLWTELAKDGMPPTAFTTATELMRTFWQMRRRQLHVMADRTEVEAALVALVERMDRDGTTHVPDRVLDTYSAAKTALLSLNLISASEGRLTFAHQTFFDHLFVSHLLDEIGLGREDLCAWLKRTD
jgi:hypothetical protein